MSDEEEPRIPFGNYKGKNVWLVPSGLLKWIVDNFDDDSLVEAAEEEYQHRERYNCHWYD